jgi:hypothetical protein
MNSHIDMASFLTSLEFQLENDETLTRAMFQHLRELYEKSSKEFTGEASDGNKAAIAAHEKNVIKKLKKLEKARYGNT